MSAALLIASGLFLGLSRSGMADDDPQARGAVT
jgi:hypothetical protein